MISYRQVDESALCDYSKIPMCFACTSIYAIKRINNGLEGVLFEEVAVDPYTRDLNMYDPPLTWTQAFDTANWAFFMAYDGDAPVGGATVASRTDTVGMLDGRDDITVLWDIRVDERYKRRGIGSNLFDMAADWSRENGFTQMKIETQNNNVAACKFYHQKGAYLAAFDAYACYTDPFSKKHEFGFIWYLDL